ncbi:putative zinc ribbon protein [Escherichia coli]|uniref:putative zinc ribbon protein n=1 Tax=Escherichia coli TaxID=562 RepID=UPI000BB6BFE7|nr:putative zinc ribbon protein [Escherichia coli]
MYAKSFLAFDGNGRLTGARTAQTAPYDRYTCHLCGSALRYHPQYDTERPWFEHTDDGLTKHVVRKASWHCRQCQHDYYGERYCTHCHTGRFSEEAVAG